MAVTLVNPNALAQTFTTIQEAIDLAQSGAVITIGADTYVEQVTIFGKDNLTIQTDGGEVIVKAPAVLAVNGQSDYFQVPVRAVIAVVDSTGINISGVEIDGDFAGDTTPGSNGDELTGLAYLNSSGEVLQVEIRNVSNSPNSHLFGLQHGSALLVDGTGLDTAPTVSVVGSNLHDFQKVGALIFGVDISFTGNTISGIGATGLTAQNGIQIAQSKGSISDNIIEAFGYSGPDYYASGIIAYEPTGALGILLNTIVGASGGSAAGLDLSDTNGQIVTIGDNNFSQLQYGIYAYSYVGEDLGLDSAVIASNNYVDISVEGLHFDPEEVALPNSSFSTSNGFTASGNQALDSISGSDGNDTFSGGDGNDSLNGRGGDDSLTGDAGDDSLTGGAGKDTANYAGAATIARTADGWSVTDAGGTDTLDSVEIVDDVAAGKTLLVGNGGFATIQDALAAAADGDTIMLSVGTHSGDVTITKDVTILGANAGDNVGVAGDARTGAESILSGLVFIAANGVTLDGLKFTGSGTPAGYAFPTAVAVAGNAVSITNSVFEGDDSTVGIVTQTVTDLAVTRSLFSGYGAGAYVSGGGSSGSFSFNIFRGVDGTTETGMGNGILTESAGVVIDSNIFHSLYSGSIYALYFETGGSVNLNASIYDNGFENTVARPIQFYANDSALTTVSGTDVGEALILDTGTPAQGMFAHGAGGNDSLYGTGFGDDLRGGAGDDLLVGGGGDDRLVGDELVGGDGIDTAAYAATLTMSTIGTSTNAAGFVTGFTQLNAAGEGTDELIGVERLSFDHDAVVLELADPVQLFNASGKLIGTFDTIQAALTAAVEGQTIRIGAGTFDGSITVNKAVSILGANAGIAGNGARGAETVIDGGIHMNAAGATLDGLKVLGGGVLAGNPAGIYVDKNDVTLTNLVVQGDGTSGTGIVTPFGGNVSGLTLSNSVVDDWSNGTYFNPTTQFTASGNSFDGNFVALTGDDWAAGTLISGNSFTNSGGIHVGYGSFDTTEDMAVYFGWGNNFDGAGRHISVSAYGDGTPGGQTIFGTDGKDSISGQEYVAGSGNDSTFHGRDGDDRLSGNAGNDTLNGDDGNDDLRGGLGSDQLNGGSGNDLLSGGGEIDTAVFADPLSAASFATVADGNPNSVGSQPGWTVTTSSEGMDTLTGVEIVDGAGAGKILLVGSGGFATIQAAIDAAADGDTILVAPGTFDEDLLINKAVTILGAEAGNGTDGRDAAAGTGETTIIGHAKVNATDGVTIDGVRFLNDATTTGGGAANPTLMFLSGGGTNGHTITNSIFWSTLAGGANGVDDRAISSQVLADGKLTIVDNLISGASQGQFGTASWGRGIWFDGGGVDLVATGNRIEWARTGVNLDMSGDSTANVSENSFRGLGSAISLAIDTVGLTVADNDHQQVGSDFNFRNLTSGVTFDAEAAIDALTAADTTNDIAAVLGGSGADVLTGTAGADLLDGNNGPNAAATDADVLNGAGGNDSLFGRGGDDLLDGGAGNDALDGGAGNDTASYGDSATITNVANVWKVTNAGGTDTLSGIEIVDDSASGRTLLVGSGGFASITDALVAAADGDTILLAPGTYAETITITKDVTILGPNAGVPGSGSRGAEAVIDGGVHVHATGVTLDGLTVLGGATLAGNPAGIYVDMAGATLTNLIVQGDGTATYGVLTPGGVTGLTLSNSVVDDWGNGTYFNPGTQFTATGNSFDGNGVALTGDDWGDGTAISGNSFTNSQLGHVGYGAFDSNDNVGEYFTGGNSFDASGGRIGIFAYGDGDAGGQTITGTEFGDYMAGAEYVAGSGNDAVFNGEGGDDSFDGGAGDDVLNGGAGVDKANYAAALANATVGIATNNAGFATAFTSVTTASEGTDQLDSVELLSFDGGATVLDINDPVQLFNAGGNLIGTFDTIQSAITAAVDGETIRVAAGTFDGPINVNKDVTILGANAGSSGTGSRVAETVIDGGVHMNAAGSTLDGVKILGLGTLAGNQTGIYVNKNGVTLTNLVVQGEGTGPGILTPAGQEVSGLAVSNSLVSGWLQGTYFNPTTQFTIDGSRFTGNVIGIVGDDWADGSLITNTTSTGNSSAPFGYGVFDSTEDFGAFLGTGNDFGASRLSVFAYGNAGAGQTVLGSSYADSIFQSGGSARDDVFHGLGGNDRLRGGTGNDTLVGGSGDDIVDGGAGKDTAQFADVITVADITRVADVDSITAGNQPGWKVTTSTEGADTISGVEIVDGAGSANILLVGSGGFATIQAAIHAAADGDTILLAPGTYVETVTVNKDVTILGPNHGVAGNGTRGAEAVIDGGVHMQAVGATLDGLTVLGGGTLAGNPAGIYVDADGVTLTNLIVQGDGTAGSGIVTPFNGNVSGLILSNSVIDDWTNGTYFNPTTQFTATGNSFDGNGVALTGDDWADGTLISGNSFTNSASGHVGYGAFDTIDDVGAYFGSGNSFDPSGGRIGIFAYGDGDAGGQTISGTEFGDYMAGAEFVPGSGNDATFLGKGGDDYLDAGAGNDMLHGGSGNDTLDGGEGTDTAVFTGNRLDYTFGGTLANATLSDKTSNRDGADTLVGVEKVQFANGTFTLDAILNNAPGVIGDLTNNAVDENSALDTSIGTVQATDANSGEGGDTLTYSLVDNADGRFRIDPTTGELFVLDPSKLDAEQALSHDILVRVTDAGGLITEKTFTINVTDVDEVDIGALADTDDAANSVAENSAVGTLVGIDVNAVDGDVTRNAVTYELTDSAGGRFAIDTASGVVKTAQLLNFEQAASHQITVRATSADGSSSTQTYTVDVTNVAETPVISSNGGGDTGVASIDEDLTTTITTVTATDDDGTSPTYSIAGGADAAKFDINASTGALSFKVGPDFENPTDGDGDNVYEVIVKASDGTLFDTQALSITVKNAAETQTIFLTNGADTFPANGQVLSDDNYVVDGLGGDDIIMTAGGNDVVRGSGGNDTIHTGGGDDVIVYVSGANGADAVDGGDGEDEIRAQAASATIGLTSVTNVEKITANNFGGVKIVGSNLADNLDFASVELVGITSIDGASGNDTIKGSAAADTIIGGAGNDILFGNGGNDTFLVTGTSGLDSYDGGEGSDTISATANSTLNLLSLTSIEAITGAGNTATVKITGTSGNDTLNFSNTTLTNIASIDGGAGIDTITGSSGNDTIIGGSGNDDLNGGGGDDTFLIAASAGIDKIDGGTGNNTIRFTAANAVLTWSTVNNLPAISNIQAISGISPTGVALAGTKISGTSVDDSINLAAITLTNISAIDGGAGADTIAGSMGNDVIIGGNGNDNLSGGEGDDEFHFAAGAGQDVINGGGGNDTIRALAANAILVWGTFSSVEKVSGISPTGVVLSNVKIGGTSIGDNINLTGYTLENIAAIDGGSGTDTITGTSGADIIVGGAGNDVLDGGEGDDTFLFAASAGTDTITGGAGYDIIKASASNAALIWNNFNDKGIEEISGLGSTNVTLIGSKNNDLINVSAITLTNIAAIDGGAGNDTITGSSAADKIVGGAGADMLTGGGGADIFDYNAATESRGLTIDKIFGFASGEDKIDFTDIDGNSASAGDQPLTFIGYGAFTGGLGELRIEVVGNITKILVDLDGNKVADMEVQLDGAYGLLNSGDFLL